MSAILMLWALAAAAADPVPPAHVVHADGDRVREVLTDLSSWPAVWGLDDPSRWHARGTAGTLEQELLWSAGEPSRARMHLLTMDDSETRYELQWDHVGPLALGTSVDAHVGRLELQPVADGTQVTWQVEGTPEGKSLKKRQRRGLYRRLDKALMALSAVAEAPAAAVEPPLETHDAVVVWRGFHHRWTYNHRINRSGDWWSVPTCEGDTCTAEHVHASASGSGADRATFEGFSSLLTGPGIEGHYGTVSLWLHGKEGEVLTDRACVPLAADVPPGPALLRGYDLDAVESADSLWEVAVTIAREDDQVCADVTLRMDCKTPECGTDRLTTYGLTLPFVVATGADLEWTTTHVVQEHQWRADDLRDEPRPAEHDLTHELPDEPVAVGLSGFSVKLDAALHTRGLDLAVRPRADESLADVDLFYVQWGPVEIAPLTVAQFAHSGDAELTVDLVELRPAAGCVARAQIEGLTFWPGKSADASVPMAEHHTTTTFPRTCEAPPTVPAAEP